MSADAYQSIAQLIDLSGRRAVITGAAQGIGAAIARRLGEAGAELALLDNNADALERTVEDLHKSSITARGEIVDLNHADALASMFDEMVKALGGLDIWINNAGISPRIEALKTSDADWDHVLNVNLKVAFKGATLAARNMAVSGTKGVIVNIASTSVKRATGNPMHYRVSKHGLVGLTQSLAVELGPLGIRVVAVAPTLTDTPWVLQLRATGYAEGFDRFVKRLPLRRMATPDDVARVVLFAASGLAAFVTGTVLEVDGGESCA